MKCRKVIKNGDHYDIVWFGKSEKNLLYAIIFKLHLEDIIDITKVTDNNGIITNKSDCQLIENVLTINSIDMNNHNFSYTYTGVENLSIYVSYYTQENYYGEIKNEKNLQNNYERIILTPGENVSLDFKFKSVGTVSSYAEKQEGLASSLIQRLSVIKGELWYMVNYGLPIFNKVKDKTIMDSVIIDIILSHSDVANIKNFESEIENNTYYIKKLSIISIFNEEILLY